MEEQKEDVSKASRTYSFALEVEVNIQRALLNRSAAERGGPQTVHDPIQKQLVQFIAIQLVKTSRASRKIAPCISVLRKLALETNSCYKRKFKIFLVLLAAKSLYSLEHLN